MPLLTPLLALAVAGQALSGAELRYQTLVAAAQADAAAPVDWRALRTAYAERPTFNVMDGALGEKRKAIFEASAARDGPKMLAAAQALIAYDYVDGEAHILAAGALRELGRIAEADREHAIGLGLLKSIMVGDGLTAATAFSVINVDEEYELMRARQRTVVRQSLVPKEGHTYDVLTARNADGQEIDFWFNIDAVIAAEAKPLAPRP